LSDHVLAAFLAAGVVTVAENGAAVGTLAVASVWDSAIYFQALRGGACTKARFAERLTENRIRAGTYGISAPIALNVPGNAA
jgi:hypothetical protein